MENGIKLRTTVIDDDRIERALNVLLCDGYSQQDAETVLQAIGYTLLDTELFPDEDEEEETVTDQFVQFVEENFDGRGTNDEVIIAIKRDKPLTNGHGMRLEKAIKDIRNECGPEGFDLDYLAKEAVRRVFGPDVEVEVVYPDIVVEF